MVKLSKRVQRRPAAAAVESEQGQEQPPPAEGKAKGVLRKASFLQSACLVFY